jgi:hypothetical protein
MRPVVYGFIQKMMRKAKRQTVANVDRSVSIRPFKSLLIYRYVSVVSQNAHKISRERERKKKRNECRRDPGIEQSRNQVDDSECSASSTTENRNFQNVFQVE